MIMQLMQGDCDDARCIHNSQRRLKFYFYDILVTILHYYFKLFVYFLIFIEIFEVEMPTQEHSEIKECYQL